MHALLCFPNMQGEGMYLIIRLFGNEFLSGIAKIPARKDLSHRVDSSHSTEAWKVFVVKTEQVRNPGRMFSLTHTRAKLRLFELAHDAIHPSENDPYSYLFL
jgi:hypothetical protein